MTDKKEALVVASKLKNYIREKSGMNTSASVIDVLLKTEIFDSWATRDRRMPILTVSGPGRGLGNRAGSAGEGTHHSA